MNINVKYCINNAMADIQFIKYIQGNNSVRLNFGWHCFFQTPCTHTHTHNTHNYTHWNNSHFTYVRTYNTLLMIQSCYTQQSTPRRTTVVFDHKECIAFPAFRSSRLPISRLVDLLYTVVTLCVRRVILTQIRRDRYHFSSILSWDTSL